MDIATGQRIRNARPASARLSSCKTSRIWFAGDAPLGGTRFQTTNSEAGIRFATNRFNEGNWGCAPSVRSGKGRTARPAELGNEIAMELAQARAASAPATVAFSRLSPVERRILATWIATARKGGIETAEDLGLRPWPGLGTETVIGVFRSGHLLASWLIVGRGDSWAVASCGDSAVSARVSSLADALALVYPRDAGSQDRSDA